MKRKLKPFDVINVSITTFAHKFSPRNYSESGESRGKNALVLTSSILRAPEYKYSLAAARNGEEDAARICIRLSVPPMKILIKKTILYT